MTKPRPIRDRFPAPWHIEEMPAGFRIVDNNGTPLTYIYTPDERVRTSMSAALTPTEARALAAAITRLPDLL